MFSGIIEETGVISALDSQPGKLVLTITASLCLEGLRIGDSIGINGVCLTVITFDCATFTVEAIAETLRLTTLAAFSVFDPVNLERALRASDRIGGHFVQGHVDDVATIDAIEKDGDSLKVWVTKPERWADCFVPKGFITLDGMSLTLVDVTPHHFSVCFIPHTQRETIVKHYQVGTKVNVEIDHITKTVVNLVKHLNIGAVHG